MSGTTTLVWFRRDLRLSDNPALAAAVADSDHVVAVYLHAPVSYTHLTLPTNREV